MRKVEKRPDRRDEFVQLKWNVCPLLKLPDNHIVVSEIDARLERRTYLTTYCDSWFFQTYGKSGTALSHEPINYVIGNNSLAVLIWEEPLGLKTSFVFSGQIYLGNRHLLTLVLSCKNPYLIFWHSDSL
jgi:hypothetical protein